MMNNKSLNNKSLWLVLLLWWLALVATLGSLYFSEIRGFIPCSLCWYQRIVMYPLCFIFLVGYYDGMYQQEKKGEEGVKYSFIKYSLPLVVTGWVIAFYHNLLVWKIVDPGLSPCRDGIPCDSTYIKWQGFITIPLLSLVAFTLILLITIGLLVLDRMQRKETSEIAL